MQVLFQLCMELYEEKVLYNDHPNNHNMNLVRYLAAIMDESSLLHHKADPSQ
jgi:hypothetical protein